MKHLHELSITDICELFTRPWVISEKFDGSYVRAGLDDTGRFYTERKGNHKRYYHVDDWDDLPWTNGFRSAHLVLEGVIQEYFKGSKMNATEYFGNGDYFDIEIINGKMPNAIDYSNAFTDDNFNRLIITGGTKYVGDSYLNRRDTDSSFKTNTFYFDVNGINIANDVWFSKDGSTLEKIKKHEFWFIQYNVPRWHYDHIHESTPKDINQLERWLSRTIFSSYYIASRYDILRSKLTSKPEFVLDETWRVNRKACVAELKETREACRKQLEMWCNIYARSLKYQFFYKDWRKHYNPSGHEGLVIYAPSNTPQGKAITCKLVDKEHFAPLNNFTHIVRYWLQGGRRPNRPSFMSRTKDWPVEKRLARLETLRQRYVSNKDKIKLSNRFSKLNYNNSEELDQRTLLLFAELKQRITNGRTSVQDENSQNP